MWSAGGQQINKEKIKRSKQKNNPPNKKAIKRKTNTDGLEKKMDIQEVRENRDECKNRQWLIMLERTYDAQPTHLLKAQGNVQR